VDILITFFAALVVSLIAIPVSGFQRERLASAIEKLIAETSAGDVDRVSGKQLRVYISQSLDVAYGFPSAVLTITAFNSILMAGSISTVALILVSVITTLIFVWIVNPEKASWYLRLQIGRRGGDKYGTSVITIALIVANLVGSAWSLLNLVGADVAA